MELLGALGNDDIDEKKQKSHGVRWQMSALSGVYGFDEYKSVPKTLLLELCSWIR